VYKEEKEWQKNDNAYCLAPHTSPNLHQAAILHFIDRHILSRGHFSGIAKFDEDILNHNRALASGRFSVLQFWPWTLTLTSQKLVVTFGTDAR